MGVAKIAIRTNDHFVAWSLAPQDGNDAPGGT